eukprot:4727051-Alexandrium_andersonii.AAC.1
MVPVASVRGSDWAVGRLTGARARRRVASEGSCPSMPEARVPPVFRVPRARVPSMPEARAPPKPLPRA